MQSRKLEPTRLRRRYRIHTHTYVCTSTAWNNLSFVSSLTSILSLFPSFYFSSPSLSASFPSPFALSLSLSLSLFAPFLDPCLSETRLYRQRATRPRSSVEYRRFREILRKNLHNFRNWLLMSEMKEPGRARSGLPESFRLFLYKFSSSSPFSPRSIPRRRLSDLKLQNLEDRDPIRDVSEGTEPETTRGNHTVPAGYCSRWLSKFSLNFGNLLATRDKHTAQQQGGAGRWWRFLKGEAEK